MLIGIALVVDELNKGPRLVIRYPFSTTQVVIKSSENLRYYTDYLNISAENFAKLFRPKQGLCNKVLDVCIDDLQYVSCAFTCASGEAVGSITMFNIVLIKVRDRCLALSNHSSSLIYPKEFYYRVVESFSNILIQLERQELYVSKQVTIMLRRHEINLSTPLALTNSREAMLRPAMPIPVDITQAVTGGANSASPDTTIVATVPSVSVVESHPLPIADAVLHETSDVSSINISNTINYHSHGQSPHLSLLSPPVSASANRESPMYEQTHTHSQYNLNSRGLFMMGAHRSHANDDSSQSQVYESSLAREITELYHSITEAATINLLVAGRIWLHIDSHSILSPPCATLSSAALKVETAATMSLLLLTSTSSVLHSLVRSINPSAASSIFAQEHRKLQFSRKVGSRRNQSGEDSDDLDSDDDLQIYANIDSNVDGTETPDTDNSHDDDYDDDNNAELETALPSSLVDLINATNPTTSLADMSVRLGQPVWMILERAQLLIRLGLAKAIRVLTATSAYQINPAASISTNSAAYKNFESRFSWIAKELTTSVINSSSGTSTSSSKHSAATSNSSIAISVSRKNCTLVSFEQTRVSTSFFILISYFNRECAMEDFLNRLPARVKPHGVDLIVWLLVEDLVCEIP